MKLIKKWDGEKMMEKDMEKNHMRKIRTLRFGSCDILLNLDLILDHLFDSRIFCSIFSCNHDI